MTSRGKHSYLQWILVCARTDSCMFGWPALTNLSGNLKDRFADCGLRCFFHGEPLVNPTDAFFFSSLFFGSAISSTRLSNTNHSIGRAWHRTFPPRLFDPSDLLGLFVTCIASFIRLIRVPDFRAAHTRIERKTFSWISNNVAYLLEQTSS